MNDRDDEDLLDKFGLGGTSRDHDEATFTPDTAAPDNLNGWEEIVGEQLRGGPAPIFTSVAGVTLNKKRVFSIGFPTIKIAPGCTKTVQARAGCLFRGHKILADCPDGYDDLVITNCFVGQRPQTPLRGVPVTAFTTASLDNSVLMDTVDPSLDITIQVQNTGSVARQVKFVIFGEAILLINIDNGKSEPESFDSSWKSESLGDRLQRIVAGISLGNFYPSMTIEVTTRVNDEGSAPAVIIGIDAPDATDPDCPVPLRLYECSAAPDLPDLDLVRWVRERVQDVVLHELDEFFRYLGDVVVPAKHPTTEATYEGVRKRR